MAERWQPPNPGSYPKPAVPCYGQRSVDELRAFCADLEHQAKRTEDRRHQPGKAEKTTATVIVRARDLLGNDSRHFILLRRVLYCLAAKYLRQNAGL